MGSGGTGSGGRTRRLVAILALLLGLAVAGCASPAGTPAASAAASAFASAFAFASPSESGAPSPSPSPIVGYTGGPATATVTLPSGTLSYAGGSCEHGSADAWLAVNIGQPNGPEYFGLVAGRSPYGPTDLQVAAGGGTLKGDAVLVTYLHAGAPFVLDHDSATVILVTDLSGGTFSGHLADGTQVRGSFSC